MERRINVQYGFKFSLEEVKHNESVYISSYVSVKEVFNILYHCSLLQFTMFNFAAVKQFREVIYEGVYDQRPSLSLHKLSALRP